MPPSVTRGKNSMPAPFWPRLRFAALMVLNCCRVMDTRWSICVSVAARDVALLAQATTARPVLARTIFCPLSDLYFMGQHCGAGSRAIADKETSAKPQAGLALAQA